MDEEQHGWIAAAGVRDVSGREYEAKLEVEGRCEEDAKVDGEGRLRSEKRGHGEEEEERGDKKGIGCY